MRLQIIVLASFLLAMIPVSAEPTQDCDAPCGYINPIMDLVFTEKPPCGAGGGLGATVGPESCITLPAAIGESVSYEGTLRWYWDVTNEAYYPNDPATNIEISFSGANNNPKWIQFDIEPSTFTLSTVDLVDPNNFEITPGATGQVVVLFNFERPITITFTRTGDPDEGSIKQMRDRDGVLPFFVKGKSTESGDRYKEAYGIEEFRFHAGTDKEVAKQVGVSYQNEPKATPGFGLVFGLLAIAAVALRRRN